MPLLLQDKFAHLDLFLGVVMSHYITVAENVRIFAQDWGSGKPLVFIPGWPFDHRCYEYQFTQLTQHGFRCIGIDMRGYGRSDRPWGHYNYDIFADDIQAVLEHLKIKNAMLIGHSMGGAIALHYVARHGNKHVSQLTLCGAAAPIWTQRADYPYGFTKETVNEMIDLCYTDRAQLLVNFGKDFFRTPTALSPALSNWFHSIAMDASAYATAMCMIALRDTDLRNELSKVTVPTAILHGKHDKICPFDFATVMHQGIKNSTIIPFENSGHGLFYDEREKFNKTIMELADGYLKS